MLAVAAGLGMLDAPRAWAQPAQAAAPRAEVSWHHQMLYRIIAEMAEQMSRGDLTGEQRMQVGERMERMATLMRRMSSLAARPAMANPESQKQMEAMGRETDAMMRHARMRPGAKRALRSLLAQSYCGKERLWPRQTQQAWWAMAEAYCADRSEGDGRRPSHRRH